MSTLSLIHILHKSVVVELEDKVETDEQTDGDYVVDEKHKTCTLTAKGIQKAEEYFKVCLLYTSYVKKLSVSRPDRALVRARACRNFSLCQPQGQLQGGLGGVGQDQVCPAAEPAHPVDERCV